MSNNNLLSKLDIVYGDDNKIGISVKGNKTLFYFENKLLELKELPKRLNNNMIRLGAISLDEEQAMYLIEDIYIDMDNNKYFRLLVGVSKERPVKESENIYHYIDFDNNICFINLEDNSSGILKNKYSHVRKINN